MKQKTGRDEDGQRPRAPTDHGVQRNVSDRDTLMTQLPRAAPTLGRQRAASTTIATIMATRNSRQISWINEPMLPALSSTRAKSRPLEQVGHAAVGQDRRPTPRRPRG